MAETTGISWCHHTWSPWIGCQAVSAACDRCYAEDLTKRWGGDFSIRRRTSLDYWKQLRRWNRKAEKDGMRRRVFPSMCDPFDNRAPEGALADMWAEIRATPWLDYLLLTKRPQNIPERLPADWGVGYPNVWLGTTVENQVEGDRRIPQLLAVPSAVRFLSCEPLLGPLDLFKVRDGTGFTFNALSKKVGISFRGVGIDWVIPGGESGPVARPMHPDWARSLRDQCAAAGVPFFFKQWGEWLDANSEAFEHLMADSPRFEAMGEYEDPVNGCYRVGKKRAGDLLDGHQHHEFPVRLCGDGRVADVL